MDVGKTGIGTGVRGIWGHRIFHKSFNPELYFYKYDRIDPEKDYVFLAV
jgi:hypothetical protein